MAEKPTYEELERRIREIEQTESERKRSERILWESREKFQVLSEQSIMGIAIIQKDGFRYVNEAYLNLTGYPKDEILAMSVADTAKLIHPDYSDFVMEQGRKKMSGETEGIVSHYTYKGITKSGEEKWVEQFSKPVVWEGKPADLLTFIDITHLKQVEESLRESKSSLQSVFEAVPVGICFMKDRVYQRVNKNWCERFGYPEESLLGRTTEFLYENKKEYDRVGKELAEQILEQGISIVHTRLKRSDGEFRDVDLIAKSLNSQNIADGTVVAVHDITEQKQAEEALHKSEEKYRNIFYSLTDVYFKTTLDGTIENASPSAKTISGYSPEELKGKKVDILYHNPKDREGLLAVLKQKGQARGYEILFKKKNGELYHTSINADLNYNKDGEPTNLTGTIRDITESKQAEEEKILAQKIAGKNEKLALVGKVAGKMAHDFNNILGIVMGNTELALLDCQDPKTKKTLELIYEQTIRGRNLTRNLVAFAKDQEPNQEFFRISEKIDLVLNLMRKDLEGIELRKEESPGVPELLADPGMIEHALVNLIQNSIHALSLVEYPRITVRTYSRDNHICLEIEDSGCGISKQNLANIYEPSFTLKGSRDVTGSYKAGIKGTGYGMSNVKKYIEQHKGSISIESQIGSGTKFTISLPVIKKGLTIQEKIELQEEIKHFEKYILLVEDETAISNVQYRILTDKPCKHKVDIANTGRIAMDLFDRNEYDFVSLDYVLPGGINGMDFYHHIRKTNRTLPILFISGNIEFLESIKELKQKDAYIDHLSKPCQNKDYLNGINELLEKTIAQQ